MTTDESARIMLDRARHLLAVADEASDAATLAHVVRTCEHVIAYLHRIGQSDAAAVFAEIDAIAQPKYDQACEFIIEFGDAA